MKRCKSRTKDVCSKAASRRNPCFGARIPWLGNRWSPEDVNERFRQRLPVWHGWAGLQRGGEEGGNGGPDRRIQGDRFEPDFARQKLAIGQIEAQQAQACHEPAAGGGLRFAAPCVKQASAGSRWGLGCTWHCEEERRDLDVGDSLFTQLGLQFFTAAGRSVSVSGLFLVYFVR